MKGYLRQGREEEGLFKMKKHLRKPPWVGEPGTCTRYLYPEVQHGRWSFWMVWATSVQAHGFLVLKDDAGTEFRKHKEIDA